MALIVDMVMKEPCLTWKTENGAPNQILELVMMTLRIATKRLWEDASYIVHKIGSRNDK